MLTEDVGARVADRCGMPPQHLVHLASDRRRYEQLVASRFSTLSIQDAEDVVSDALIAVADRIPEDAGRAWFARVVINRAEDFRRARDGRPRTGPGRRQVPLEAAFDRPAPQPEDPHDRELAHRTVHRALERLPAEQRALLSRRHLGGRGPRRGGERARPHALAVREPPRGRLERAPARRGRRRADAALPARPPRPRLTRPRRGPPRRVPQLPARRPGAARGMSRRRAHE